MAMVVVMEVAVDTRAAISQHIVITTAMVFVTALMSMRMVMVYAIIAMERSRIVVVVQRIVDVIDR
jgi:uncharacterized protein YjgD (DUF1641 family)